MTEYSDTYWNNLLAQYQAGTISKDDQYKLEKRALDDPFLFDALEGFSLMNAENEEKKKSKTRILTLPRMAAAASLVFLVAMIFLLKNDGSPENLPNQESIAMVLDKDTNEESNKEVQESNEIAIEKEQKTATEKRKTSKTKEKVSEKVNSNSKIAKKSNPIPTTTSVQNDIVQEDAEESIAQETTVTNINNNSTDVNSGSEEMADVGDEAPVTKAKVKEELHKVFYKVEPAIGVKDFEEYVRESIENRGLQQNPPLKVTIEFDIKKDGSITNFLHIFNGCSQCGAYAIYLLSGSGVWKTIPEGQEGKARYTLEF